jgi:ribonuclease HI
LEVEDLLSTQYWRKVVFKGQEIWGECDADGELLERSGRVRIAYKEGAAKAYATFKGRIEVSASSALSEFTIAVDGKGGGKTKQKANSSLFGGTAADLVNPALIHLWTDGACTGNPGPAGAGTVLLRGESKTEWSTWLGEGTNNIAELVAVLQGVQELERPIESDLVVHTDSQYVIGVCAKNWKAKANKELIAELKVALADAPRVVWHWVRGHEGVELNERCDQLARDAIVRRDSTRVEGAR